MIPLVIAGAAALGSAVIQWQNSEAARRASAEERQKMQDLLNSIEDPEFDMSKIDPPKLQVLSRYLPEMAQFVQEQAPVQIQAKTEGATVGREAQLAALQQMRSLSETGSDAQTRAAMQQGLNAASAQMQGNRQAILQDAGQRGTLNSGNTLVAQLMAQQQSGRLAQDAALQSSAEGERRRLQAIRDSASMGSQVRGEDIDLEAQNASVINDFNRRTAAAKQNWMNQGVDVRNEAQKFNRGEDQRLYESNAMNQYKANVGQQDLVNKQRQQAFTNKLNKAGQQSNVTDMARKDIMGAAQDKNTAVSGASQAVGTFAGYAQNQGAKNKKSTNVLEEEEE